MNNSTKIGDLAAAGIGAPKARRENLPPVQVVITSRHALPQSRSIPHNSKTYAPAPVAGRLRSVGQLLVQPLKFNR